MRPIWLIIIGCGMYWLGYHIARKNQIAIPLTNSAHDYQLDVHYDTVWLYEGDRLVKSWIQKDTDSLYSIILKDNE